MPSQLIHIYGPFSIQIFGVMVMLGLLWFVYQLCKDKPLALYLAHEDIFNLATWAIGAGILGARILYIVTNQHEFTSWHSMLFIWQGGFSILGAISGVLACLVIYLYIRNIPILYVTDRCALYAPITSYCSHWLFLRWLLLWISNSSTLENTYKARQRVNVCSS
ncbi:prolipoprotein diacylglyceryl transferase [Vermiphilus pyriformis]|nr:MAG: prolipoprotein diacylglyceryl transferase [Vermiphilus pyriformis]